MNVKIFSVDKAGQETLVGISDLQSCFGDELDQSADYDAARQELQRASRVWIGGGAAQLFLLKKVNS